MHHNLKNYNFDREKVLIMTKEKIKGEKHDKKAAAKTLKEKRAAKAAKREEKKHSI